MSLAEMDAASPPDAPTVVPRTPEAAADAFGATLETIKGEAGGALKKTLAGSGAAAGEELKAALAELQSWDDKAKSGTVVALSFVTFWLTYGDDGYNLASVVCYLLALRILLLSASRQALESVEKSDKKEKLASVVSLAQRIVVGLESVLVVPSPSSVSKVVGGFAALIESRVNKVCAYVVLASEPSEEGKRAFFGALGHIVGLLVALRFASVGTLLFVYVLYQMTWPAIYSRHQEKIDAAVAKAKAAAAPHVEVAKEKAGVAKDLAVEKAKELLAKAHEAAKPHLEKVMSKLNKGTPAGEEESKPLVGEKTE